MEAQALFQTVPKKNLLGLLGPHGADPERTRDFLGLKKEDIALAANVPLGSVRFDDRMPEAVRERMLEIATVCELVAEHFGSSAKAALWFKVPNPLLGGLSPRAMIRMGRFRKLHRFVLEALMGL